MSFHTQSNKEVHMPEAVSAPAEANAVDYAILEDLIEKLGGEQVRRMVEEVTASDSQPA